MIPPHVVDLVKRSTNMQTLVAEYGVELRPSGSRKLGFCPFCPKGQRTPAFAVHADHAYCHRCQTYTDPVKWVMRHDSVKYSAAIERLALRAGITITGRITPIAAAAYKEDVKCSAWWWARHQTNLIAELSGSLMFGPPADKDSWEWACTLNRMIVWVNALPHAQRLEMFQNSVRGKDRSAWRREMQDERDFEKCWMGLAAESVTAEPASAVPTSTLGQSN